MNQTPIIYRLAGDRRPVLLNKMAANVLIFKLFSQESQRIFGENARQTCTKELHKLSWWWISIKGSSKNRGVELNCCAASERISRESQRVIMMRRYIRRSILDAINLLWGQVTASIVSIYLYFILLLFSFTAQILAKMGWRGHVFRTNDGGWSLLPSLSLSLSLFFIYLSILNDAALWLTKPSSRIFKVDSWRHDRVVQPRSCDMAWLPNPDKTNYPWERCKIKLKQIHFIQW